MELTVLERLVLLSLLPKEGNVLTLRLMRKLKEGLSFSEEEHKELNFVQEGDQLRWDMAADVVKDVEVGETMNELIKKILKDLEDKSKLTENQITLFEKFVENAPKEQI